MKLSTRTRYGVRLMLALARQYSQGPVFLWQVAKEEEISEKYLSQIIITLRGQGLVNSTRGARGGYTLAKSPADITLRQIVDPLEGGNHLVDCVQQASICNNVAMCVTRDVWAELGNRIAQYLESVTLEHLVKNQMGKVEASIAQHI